MATDPTEQLVRLFAEESRVRAFAAVALGAGSSEQVARAAGLSPKETAVALLRLREQGVVVAGGDGELGVAYGLFKEYAREAAQRENDSAAAGNPASGDEPTDLVLRTFVQDGRLVRLPARWTRKKLVLRHIAEQTFEPGVEYPERTVNEKLRAWCEDSDDIDHVALRRYLVDLHHLHRSEGIYRRPAEAAHTGDAEIA
ncbi:MULTISPECIES: DUF2087 domain-containing protein [unclassified Streptomyces]|uniref:DUF2087 domain-containing protein n=1 Tax=unclassified Streptomyces TaxID=2593676 RepID=UPI002365ABF9|nr:MULTISPECIES: DUF2087 domain-containing protein [unclassified Streptomyces]MDF3140209.1 DUF2087 domain-containing protein [Streptomyces sp. T21Q-yed]WDF38216.1 DUF2087 domain-containing protein [Streptomyces sp. T12]